MTKDEALKEIIDWIESNSDLIDVYKNKVEMCKEALEQPAQGIELEWYNKGWTDAIFEFEGLTDDEIDAIIKEKDGVFGAVVRAIEQALKEKNT